MSMCPERSLRSLWDNGQAAHHSLKSQICTSPWYVFKNEHICLNWQPQQEWWLLIGDRSRNFRPRFQTPQTSRWGHISSDWLGGSRVRQWLFNHWWWMFRLGGRPCLTGKTEQEKIRKKKEKRSPQLVRHTLRYYCISVDPGVTHNLGLGPLKGFLSWHGALQGLSTRLVYYSRI